MSHNHSERIVFTPRAQVALSRMGYDAIHLSETTFVHISFYKRAYLNR
jgi:hypothetical protein